MTSVFEEVAKKGHLSQKCEDFYSSIGQLFCSNFLSDALGAPGAVNFSSLRQG